MGVGVKADRMRTLIILVPSINHINMCDTLHIILQRIHAGGKNDQPGARASQ